jgi:hypothetical protein
VVGEAGAISNKLSDCPDLALTVNKCDDLRDMLQRPDPQPFPLAD